MPKYTHSSFHLLCVLLLILVTSCTTTPDRSPLDEDDNRALLSKAQQLITNDPSEAAKLYLSISQKVAPPYKQQMLYAAANAWFIAEDIEKATLTLQIIDRKTAFNDTLLPIDILQSKLLINNEEYDAALTLLDEYSADDIPPDHQVEFSQLRATCLEHSRKPLEAARQLIPLNNLLPNPQEQAQNSVRIWRLLNQVPFEQINELMPPPPDASGAWIELVYFVNLYRTNPQQLTEAIDEWRIRYPTHPAAGPLVNSLIEMLLEELEPPKQIALLLPLSGRLQAPAKAIRDGFIAAYLDHFQIDRPRIRVYDAGEFPSQIVDIYKKAVQEGADFVVGPLDKNALEILAQSSETSTPVLGLNYLPEYIETPATLFQFGLLPEDEARESARHAFESGARKAIILVPDNEWGQRNATSFSNAFTELGGEVLEENSFDAQSNDFSVPIKSLLNIDDSYNRYRQIAAISGTNYDFEPRRRQDVDVIFFAAYPKQARLIKPQLKFHRASTIPVYATSRIFSGTINPKQDSDLNETFFVDIPWVLSDRKNLLLNDLQEQWPQRTQHYLRLFAMGFDAYRIIGQLPALRQTQEFQLQGASGRLFMQNSQIHRLLELGRFVNGEPAYMNQ